MNQSVHPLKQSSNDFLFFPLECLASRWLCKAPRLAVDAKDWRQTAHWTAWRSFSIFFFEAALSGSFFLDAAFRSFSFFLSWICFLRPQIKAQRGEKLIESLLKEVEEVAALACSSTWSPLRPLGLPPRPLGLPLRPLGCLSGSAAAAAGLPLWFCRCGRWVAALVLPLRPLGCCSGSAAAALYW